MALSGVLKEIADVAGEPAAIALAAARGGTRVYIPARVGDKHWLVECVGRRAAELICKHYAVEGKRGASLDVPLGGHGAYPQLRRAIARRIHQLEQAKTSQRETARLTGVSDRTVRNHRAKRRGDPNDKQGRLI